MAEFFCVFNNGITMGTIVDLGSFKWYKVQSIETTLQSTYDNRHTTYDIRQSTYDNRHTTIEHRASSVLALERGCHGFSNADKRV